VVVRQLTDLVAAAAGDESLKQRTWVLLTEAVEGGWGLWGHAHSNAEIVTAAKAEIGKLKGLMPIANHAAAVGGVSAPQLS
jgi:phenylpyruvate tautomerase PptA (4-oxalocrotonate tautomerase family)